MHLRRPYATAAAIAAFLSATAAVAQAAAPISHRQLDYTATSATWSQLDLSPDGRTLLFDLLGDIYAMDAAGGAARPVLTGTAWERNPVFSPDGRQFAFVSDRSGVTNLWIANVDSSGLRQVSDDRSLVLMTSPAWSPDGRTLYLSRAVHSVLAFELMSYDVATGRREVVVRAQPGGSEGWDDRVNALGTVISPDGRYAYYATKLGHTWTEGDPPVWSVARRDLRGDTVETVVSGAGGAMRPVLSHDGRRLAYAARQGTRTGLRLRDLTTGDDRWLAFPVDNDAQEGGYYTDLLPRYVFTPGDSALVMAVAGGFARLDLASGGITRIPFSAPVKLALAPQTRVRQREETGPVRPRVVEGARRSPDGTRIAFTALGALYVKPLSGGGARRLVATDAFQPGWSADGRTIVYVTWNAADGGQLWTVPATGGTPTQVTRTHGFYTEPMFAADGAIVALRASDHDRMRTISEVAPDRATDIVRLSPTGGEPVTIAHAASARSLHTTADGRLFVYGAGGLSLVRPQHGDIQPLVSVVGHAASQYVAVPLPVQDARLSPDGRHIVARAASQLYLLDMPAAADKPPVLNVSTDAAAVRLTRDGADSATWNGAAIDWTVGSTWRSAAVARAGRTPGAAEARARSASLAVAVPRDVPDGTIVLRGARVVTPDRAAPIDGADVVIRANRIVAVGATGSVAVPRGAAIRDVRGKTIIPGLIDVHAHYFNIRRGLHDATDWSLRANLAYGVTAALEVQPFTTDVFAYQDMIDAGLAIGPRLWSTGPGVFGNSEIVSVDAARDVLRRYRDHYRTRNIKSYMVGDRAARQYMTIAARELGMMPTTEGASDLVLGLTHAVDGFAGNEHALPLSPLHDDVVRLIVASGMAYNPTLSVLYGGNPALFQDIMTKRPQDEAKIRRFLPPGIIADKLRNRHWTPAEVQTNARFAADALRVQRAGGLVGMGSHGEMPGLGLHWEMQAFAAGGATPMEVLRAATIDAATIIGHADDVGSITPGKFADLLILDADPLADIRATQAIAAVMKNGRLYDPQTLDELWPVPTRRAPGWFADDAATPTPGLPLEEPR